MMQSNVGSIKRALKDIIVMYEESDLEILK